MSETFPELTHLGKHAANYIATHGWIQGRSVDTWGKACAAGGLQMATHEHAQRGDWHIVAQALSAKHNKFDAPTQRGNFVGSLQWWNDAPTRTKEEVIALLENNAIYDEDLQRAFGPQWREIVALVRRKEKTIFDDSRTYIAIVTTPTVSTAIPLAALEAHNREGQGDFTSRALGLRSNHNGVAVALCARDLIGQHPEWTQELYTQLTEPWARIFGKLHPDD